MRLTLGQGNPSGGRAGIVGLLLASLACILILLLALSMGEGGSPWTLSARTSLIAAVLGAAVMFLTISAHAFVGAARHTRSDSARTAEEAARLRSRLASTESLLRIEPQALLYWEGGQPARLVSSTLPKKLGVPDSPQDILNFRGWVEPEAATEISSATERLVRDGKPFSLLAPTLAGAIAEFDGRPTGGRLVIKIRDGSSGRRELGEAVDRQRQLARDLQLMRSVYEAMPMPVWFRGADGRIDWVNMAYVRAVAAANRQEVTTRQTELLETRQRTAIETVLRSGRIHRDRLHVIVAGERRAYDLVAVPLDNASAYIATDAAALESAEGQLSMQTVAHGRTLDRVSTAVAIFGPDQRLSFCNEAYRRLWRLDLGWLAAHPSDPEILDRLREQRQLPEQADYRQWKAQLLACYLAQAEHEDYWHLPDGRTIHVVAEQRPDGGVAYLYDDVTERFAQESRYNALIGVQRETLDHLKEGVAVFGTDGRLRLFNPAFARMWRLNPQDLQREPHVDEVIRRCRVLHEDDGVWQTIKRGATAFAHERTRIDGTITRPDESVIAYGGLPLPDGAMLLTFIDITDTKRMERALIERNEALEAADRMKSQFISHVSYELRTPLTNIIGFSELLASPRTGDLNPKQREYLGDIGASSKTLLAIINDILDLATIDAGGLELNLSSVAVAEVIEAAAQGVRERLKLARQKLDIAIAPDVRAFMADGNRVKQVLYNLLSNAIGFSEPGEPVRLTCRREAAMIVFIVEDKGAGIPADQQRVVFERFVSRTQGSKHRGAGLGLAMVKSLVELHGGTVSLVSEAGQGTRVTVRFPEAGKGAPPAPAPPPQRSAPVKGRAR